MTGLPEAPSGVTVRVKGSWMLEVRGDSVPTVTVFPVEDLDVCADETSDQAGVSPLLVLVASWE